MPRSLFVLGTACGVAAYSGGWISQEPENKTIGVVAPIVFAVEAVWGRGAGAGATPFCVVAAACCGCFGARGAGRAGLQQQRVGLEAVELQLQRGEGPCDDSVF